MIVFILTIAFSISISFLYFIKDNVRVPVTRIVYSHILLCFFLLTALPAKSQQTFCNPLNLNYRFMSDAVDAREAADPVIILFKDDYYLFASRSGGYWTSENLHDWTFIVPTGLDDIEIYAPAALVMGDTVYYTASGSGQIYKTADPKSGVWTEGPSIGAYYDPALFLDDDERLYMYHGLTNTTASANIRMVELEPITFEEKGSQVDLVFSMASSHGWERRGDDNLLDEYPWIEGSWMNKINNKYYLHYAAPGTEWKTYADGIYVSSDSAKGPFEYATYSPFSFKPTGFISGAGHGCTFMDKDSNYWHIATMTISVNHMFERRLGLFPVAVDADSNIRCNTVFGDYPQYLPGIMSDPTNENFAGMLLLSHKKFATASSSVDGYGVENAVDEDARTYWSAQTGEPGEWILIDLGEECDIEAIQVNFAEHNTIPSLVRGRDVILYERYIIENSNDGMSWDTLVDKSLNMQDVPHDFTPLDETAQARYIKIINIFTPGEGNFAVRDLRVFGNSSEAVFTEVTDFTVERDADERNAKVSWDPVPDADGYVIRYGIAPDKLYNNYMVYDVDSIAIHSLNVGVEYYFSVEAFDGGTDYYYSVGEFRSFESGDWNDVNTWEQYDGSAWINPAPGIPTLSDGIITILSGDTVTLTAADSIDQVIISSGGYLVINTGTTLLIKDGIGTDLAVNGTLINSGSITQDMSATISFLDSSRYVHEQNGGSIPVSKWGKGSTCEISSVTSNSPSGLEQNFYHFTWDCSEQALDASMGWDGDTIGGNINISNTGTGVWQLCTPTSGTPVVININGDLNQTSGTVATHMSNEGETSVTINQGGSINITGGQFSISGGTQGGTGTTAWNLTDGDFSASNAEIENSSTTPGGAGFVFSKAGTQTLNIGSGNTIEELPIEVSSGTTLNIGTSELTGNGHFMLDSGATLETAHSDGIDGNIQTEGTRILSKSANYTYNGNIAQVTGSLLPDTVNNLTLDNNMGLTLSGDVVVNGIMEIKDGLLQSGSEILSYGEDGALKYSGSSAQTTGDVEFPAVGIPKDLIISNTSGVNLHSTRRITGNLNLEGKLALGANTLTAGSATTESVTTMFVNTDGGGKLSLPVENSTEVLYPIGASGGSTVSYCPVWITNNGDSDTITLGAVMDTVYSTTKPRVKLRWDIVESGVDGGDYELRFGWNPSSTHENNLFRANREDNARIFLIGETDTLEAGSGDYEFNFTTKPYWVKRGGISELGGMFAFVVGRFKDSVWTGIEEKPRSYRLMQNYPNPFNQVTVIGYELPRSSEVELVIYNLLGQEIAVLERGKKEAGCYKVEWKASNLPAGLYFYRLKADSFTDTKKLLFVK
ncbi:family 43 glycosylhydrolase [candidate division WOR-3 bacterium]|nr:family 43 glycosylhydrolase [candidate division WOR-3 bacterium]